MHCVPGNRVTSVCDLAKGTQQQRLQAHMMPEKAPRDVVFDTVQTRAKGF